MSRRPRIVHAEIVDFRYDPSEHLRDDLVVGRDGARAFVDDVTADSMVLSGRQFVIDQARIVRVADPFDWFADILVHVDAFTMPVSHPIARQRYPWLNAFWHLIGVHLRDGEEYFYRVLFDRSGCNGEILKKRLERDVERLYRQYADFNAIRQHIMVSYPTQYRLRQTAYAVSSHAIQEFTRIREETGHYYSLLHTQHAGTTLVFIVDSRFTGQLQPFLNLLKCDKIYFPLGYGVDYQNQTVDSNGKPHDITTPSQWLRYHRIILETAIIFHHLPAYVLLEVLDWLPYFNYWRHVRKISLLQSIGRSIRTIKEAREKHLNKSIKDE